jgi:uncharacterized membrane protein YphA (DoxX/SURF4 family)
MSPALTVYLPHYVLVVRRASAPVTHSSGGQRFIPLVPVRTAPFGSAAVFVVTVFWLEAAVSVVVVFGFFTTHFSLSLFFKLVDHKPVDFLLNGWETVCCCS